jgi:hypothetical protein
MLRDESLKGYFLNNFSLMQYHHYSLHELESMLPWERKTYISLVAKHVEEENEKLKLQKEKNSAERQTRVRMR